MIPRRQWPANPTTAAEAKLFVDAYLERIGEQLLTYPQIRDIRILNPKHFAPFFFTSLAGHLERIQVNTGWGHYWRYKVKAAVNPMVDAIPF